jgi:hypothetical protein
MFIGDEPNTSCLEIRALSPDGGGMVGRRFIRVYDINRIVGEVETLSPTANVFIGVAPRTSHTSGTLKDIERAWCLWADVDTAESWKLTAFRPQPSMVVRSGGKNRYHAYWQLNGPVSVEAADRANRRIKKALDADNCGDPTRILRPIGSINHKHGARVECVRLELDAFSLQDVIGTLEDDDRYKPRPRVPIRQRHGKRGTNGLVESVASARDGNRNKVLYWAGRRAGDEGTLDQVREQLVDAAAHAGLNERAARATLASAERASC